jgi:predicted esterase
VIADIRRRSGLASNGVFTLSWSSGGPAAYALSLDPECQVAGSLIAMSVFRPEALPDPSVAKGRAYYLLHSPQDFIPLAMDEKARDTLSTQGARVKLVTYEGGHGWHGDVFGQIREGLLWLAKNSGGQ